MIRPSRQSNPQKDQMLTAQVAIGHGPMFGKVHVQCMRATWPKGEDKEYLGDRGK